MKLYEIAEHMRKNALAEKVRKAKRLTNQDRADICYFLTGVEETPAKAVGRPQKAERDMEIALDYLQTRDTPKWPGWHIFSDNHGIYNLKERSCHKAFERGIAKLETYAKINIVGITNLNKIADDSLSTELDDDMKNKLKTEIIKTKKANNEMIDYLLSVLSMIKNFRSRKG